MGVVDNPTTSAPASGEHLSQMSFDYLNQIHSETVKVSVNKHTAYFGGVNKPWSNLNEIKVNGATRKTQRITDSDVFAVFQSQHSLSSDYHESPWKIHLSIDPRDLGKAWDMVYPLLLANNIDIFKTTRTSVAQRMLHEVNKLDAEQLEALHLSTYDKELAIQDMVRVFNGMQITIYIEEGHEAQYNALLQEIEPLLYKAGIRPGIIDKSDRSIGLYSSIRHVGKSYTSHEKVTGYKAVEIADEFKAIKLDWNEIQINWADFDYSKHINKAILILQQVVDAQKKYEMAIINKREFTQACEVAAEYFTRWHKLLNKTEKSDELSEKKQQLLNKFKKWIDDGKDLVPTIKKQKTRKIKEAEDILEVSLNHEKKSPKFHYPLARHNAHRNLRTLLPVGVELAPQKPLVKVSNTAEILARLGERRKKEFADIKSKSMAYIAHDFAVSVKQDVPAITSAVSITEENESEHEGQESFLALNPGLLWAILVGVSSGLLIGLIFIAFLPPIFSIPGLIGTVLIGSMLGLAGGYYSAKSEPPLQEPVPQDQHFATDNPELITEKQPRPQTTEQMQWGLRKASSLPLYRSKENNGWDPRIFAVEKAQDKADEAVAAQMKP